MSGKLKERGTRISCPWSGEIRGNISFFFEMQWEQAMRELEK